MLSTLAKRNSLRCRQVIGIRLKFHRDNLTALGLSYVLMKATVNQSLFLTSIDPLIAFIQRQKRVSVALDFTEQLSNGFHRGRYRSRVKGRGGGGRRILVATPPPPTLSMTLLLCARARALKLVHMTVIGYSSNTHIANFGEPALNFWLWLQVVQIKVTLDSISM